MRISEIKQYLNTAQDVNFMLPDGAYVPSHFHITEVGTITKDFIDCGGTIRSEKTANLQLWNAQDYSHRLTPNKLLKIINLSEKVLGEDDLEIEVEYQTNTIGKYGLHFNGKDFVLTTKQTACLADQTCGTPQKKNLALSEISTSSCCTPGSSCC
jgi:hypothetical protein